MDIYVGDIKYDSTAVGTLDHRKFNCTGLLTSYMIFRPTVGFDFVVFLINCEERHAIEWEACQENNKKPKSNCGERQIIQDVNKFCTIKVKMIKNAWEGFILTLHTSL